MQKKQIIEILALAKKVSKRTKELDLGIENDVFLELNLALLKSGFVKNMNGCKPQL